MSEKQSRAKRGAKNPRAGLTDRQVAAIRRAARKNNQPYGWQSQLARQYGTSRSVIYDILHGRTWSKNRNWPEKQASRMPQD